MKTEFEDIGNLVRQTIHFYPHFINMAPSPNVFMIWVPLIEDFRNRVKPTSMQEKPTYRTNE